MRIANLLALALCLVLACDDAPSGYSYEDRYLCTISGTETFTDANGSTAYAFVGEPLEIHYSASYVRFTGVSVPYRLVDDGSESGLRTSQYAGPNATATGIVTLTFDESVFIQVTLPGYSMTGSGGCTAISP